MEHPTSEPFSSMISQLRGDFPCCQLPKHVWHDPSNPIQFHEIRISIGWWYMDNHLEIHPNKCQFCEGWNHRTSRSHLWTFGSRASTGARQRLLMDRSSAVSASSPRESSISSHPKGWWTRPKLGWIFFMENSLQNFARSLCCQTQRSALRTSIIFRLTRIGPDSLAHLVCSCPFISLQGFKHASDSPRS